MSRRRFERVGTWTKLYKCDFVNGLRSSFVTSSIDWTIAEFQVRNGLLQILWDEDYRQGGVWSYCSVLKLRRDLALPNSDVKVCLPCWTAVWCSLNCQRSIILFAPSHTCLGSNWVSTRACIDLFTLYFGFINLLGGQSHEFCFSCRARQFKFLWHYNWCFNLSRCC
jgi:hypothetical protein